MIELNRQQQAVVDAAVKFYKDPHHQTFEFDGEAGTGKSVVLAAIKEALGLNDAQILPMAYTGQAVSVMKSKGMVEARTCHSGLLECQTGVMHDENGEVIRLPNGLPKYGMDITPKYIDPDQYKAIFLDESYMIPRSMKPYIDRTGIKVFATGDSGQLPPVKDYPAYLIPNNDHPIYHLTDYMRQDENSPIISLAKIARNIKYGMNIPFGCYGDVLVTDRLPSYDYLARADGIICGTNKTKSYLNRLIREDILGFKTGLPQYGEKMICKMNHWSVESNGISMTNGLMGYVAKPPEPSNAYKTYVMSFITQNLDAIFYNLKCDYQFLHADHEEQDYIRSAGFARTKGEKFDFAYASTVHSAQGSEYEAGIFVDDVNPHMDNYRQLVYTAITRFRSKLIYVKTHA